MHTFHNRIISRFLPRFLPFFCSLLVMLVLWSSSSARASAAIAFGKTERHRPLLHNIAPERGKAEFMRLGVEEGLSLGSVNCIYQDRYGFIWVGTQDGLNRYDGYSFTVYRRRNRADTTSLQESWISSILEDKAGALWVAGAYGLHKFNRATNTFQKISLHKLYSRTSGGVALRRIYEDSKGNIWICTREGLAYYNPATQKYERLAVPIPQHVPRRPTQVPVFVDDIVEDSDGTYWLACGPDGLYAFAPESADTASRFRYVPLAQEEQGQEYVSRLTRDHSGMMWIGTHNGLVRWNSTLRRAEDIYLADPKQRSQLLARDYFYVDQISGSAVNDIVHGRNGTIWIATSNGLFALEQSRKSITQYHHNPYDATSLVGNTIYALCEDASGVLWVGDFSYGLSVYPQEQQRFRTYRNNPIDPNSLSNNYVRGMLEDSKGNIWVCTQYGGLNMLDRTRNTWKRYRHIPGNPRSLPHDNVWSIVEDRSGDFWVGLYTRGLCRFSPSNGTFYHYNELLYPDENIACLYRDKRDNIWAGGSTVYKIGTNRRVAKVYSFSTTFITQAIYQDRHDVVWIGRDDGLWKIMANDSLVRVALPDDNVTVTMINEDAHGNLWVMTKGHGIFLINANRSAIQRISTLEGLPHQNVYAALEDERGDIWISSDNGIARYDVQTKSFRLYGTGDGLQAQEFNRRAFGITSRGEMMFGGINGFNIFQPTALRENKILPKVVLTSLQARGRTIAEASQLLELQEIHLPYTDNFLHISFAALEFNNPVLNRYSYKLEGLEEEWVDIGAKHEAYYTNLPPKTYTFRVRAANADGYWNNEGKSLRIIITPPWWQTLWAYIGYALVSLGAITGAFLLVSRRQKREFLRLQTEREALLLHSKNAELLEANAQLQMLNMEKNEILGIVSHDLKNPIAGVRGLAELLRQGFIDKDQLPLIANQILQTSDRMFDLVNNLLDINHLESGAIQLQEVIFDLTTPLLFSIEQFSAQATAKSITIASDIQPVPHLIIGDERACMQIMENLLSNAIKYSPFGKNIYVRLYHHAEQPTEFVRLEIQDEGPGLSEHEQKQLFGKFVRLSARPTAGEHSTGLGLFIVKRLVEEMHGRVWCVSELGRGSTFIVQLPAVGEEQTINAPASSLLHEASADDKRTQQVVNGHAQKRFSP